MDRVALKTLAKEQIKGKIGILAVILLIYLGINVVASFIPVIGGFASAIFLTPSLSLSITMIFLKISDKKEIAAGDIFEGFYDFWSAFKLTWLTGLFTFLWSLLLIIPGIIKSYSYSMAIFILAENKGMSALEAINKSKKMMEGHKMDFFVLQLSFLGWILLTYVTFGIALFWVWPYMYTSYANFYKSLKSDAAIDISAEDIQIED